ncbi:hypothetical protein [Shimia abyssi]|uniref:Capsular polysaccharide biosynthesis protein n=1 Tax=Shimia abyssi TaxID=1662395 RepID=A0A2P8F8A4_9RHOB|nr:hypothetical protein [Shimia abyssi]PSL17946.1 hypothetical protein CLV88_11317 [Shimia abyssi]
MLEALYEPVDARAQGWDLFWLRLARSVRLMTGEKHIRFYLPGELRDSAAEGRHNFMNKVVSVLKAADFTMEFLDATLVEPVGSEFSLFHMQEPFRQNSVTVRRAYYYPFWQIERTNERWHWDVARADFDPEVVNADKARKFYQQWQKRLYETPLKDVSNDGFVYVPLQGRLTQHRSFQTCSPVEMLQKTIALVEGRRVIAALHPNEIYSQSDYDTLEEIERRYEALELRMGEMEQLLPRCEYVVTQNSSVAFAGFFFGKPCVTFAKIDFHHIAADVERMGIEGAFEAVQGSLPEFEKYVWWFLQQMSINAGRPEAEEKIRARLSTMGWPV